MVAKIGTEAADLEFKASSQREKRSMRSDRMMDTTSYTTSEQYYFLEVHVCCLISTRGGFLAHFTVQYIYTNYGYSNGHILPCQSFLIRTFSVEKPNMFSKAVSSLSKAAPA